MEAKRYRKKPVEIEAMRYESAHEVIEWADRYKRKAITPGERWAYLEVHPHEGRMIARTGDWIIKGVQGEFYPCKPSIFEATYEEVDTGGQQP